MIDIFASNPLAKAICARRETQWHLGCLTRQIAARAGRQAITVRVRSRARRRSGPRLYRHEPQTGWPLNDGANSTRSHTGWHCNSKSSMNSSFVEMPPSRP